MSGDGVRGRFGPLLKEECETEGLKGKESEC